MIAALPPLCSSSMKAVLPRGLEVDVCLLHVLCLILLHKLIALPFGGHHLVAVVSNELLWSLRRTTTWWNTGGEWRNSVKRLNGGSRLLAGRGGVSCYRLRCRPTCTCRRHKVTTVEETKLVLFTAGHNGVSHFSRMVSFSFWSATEERLFPWFTWAQEGHEVKPLKLTKQEGVGSETEAAHLWAAGTHIKGRWTELDVTLDYEAHSFLHISFGNRQGTARLRQAAFGEHLQQVFLLVLPTRRWFLEGKNTQ